MKSTRRCRGRDMDCNSRRGLCGVDRDPHRTIILNNILMKKRVIAAIGLVFIVGYIASEIGKKDSGSDLGQPGVVVTSTEKEEVPGKAATATLATQPEPEKEVVDIMAANRVRRANLADKLKAFYAQHPHSEAQNKVIEFRSKENRLFLEGLGHNEAVVREADAIVRKRDEDLGELRLERLTNSGPYTTGLVQKSGDVQAEAREDLRRVLGETSAREFEKWEASRKTDSPMRSPLKPD